MKADAMGTPVERARAAMGWRTATQIRITGGDPQKCCRACKWRESLTRPRGDGGITAGLRCIHIKAHGTAGHATNESATCVCWSPKP